MEHLRPQLKNQPPKRKIFRKPKTPESTSFGMMTEISQAFNEIKSDFLKKISFFEKKFNQSIADVEKNKLDVEKFVNSALILNKGNKGDRGDKGASIKGDKGDKGDSVRGDTGDRGDKGDSIKGDKGEDAVLTFEMFKKFFKKVSLTIEDIDDLERRLENISRKAGSAMALGGGSGSWHQVALSGDIDGSNTVFTFTGVEPSEFSERIYLNYTEQNPFTDYTINYKTNTVTYTTAPDSSLSSFSHIIRYHT